MWSSWTPLKRTVSWSGNSASINWLRLKVIIRLLSSEVESLHDRAPVLEGDAAPDQPGVGLQHRSGRRDEHLTLEFLRRLETGAREVEDHGVGSLQHGMDT